MKGPHSRWERRIYLLMYSSNAVNLPSSFAISRGFAQNLSLLYQRAIIISSRRHQRQLSYGVLKLSSTSTLIWTHFMMAWKRQRHQTVHWEFVSRFFSSSSSINLRLSTIWKFPITYHIWYKYTKLSKIYFQTECTNLWLFWLEDIYLHLWTERLASCKRRIYKHLQALDLESYKASHSWKVLLQLHVENCSCRKSYEIVLTLSLSSW